MDIFVRCCERSEGMKKYKIPVIISVVCLAIVIGLFVNCNFQEKQYDKSVPVEDSINSRKYSEDRNTNRFYEFLKNLENKNKDRINIINYTIEGDPFITQLYFDGKDVIIFEDNSKDKFGGPDKYKILQTTIKKSDKLKDEVLKYVTERCLIVGIIN
jgi:hypothetical protein